VGDVPSVLLRAEREGVGDGCEAHALRWELRAAEGQDRAADEGRVLEARVDLSQADRSDGAVGPDVEPELDSTLRRCSLVVLREQVAVAVVDGLESVHHDRANRLTIPHEWLDLRVHDSPRTRNRGGVAPYERGPGFVRRGATGLHLAAARGGDDEVENEYQRANVHGAIPPVCGLRGAAWRTGSASYMANMSIYREYYLE